MSHEPFVVPFDRSVRTLTITQGTRTQEATITNLVCGICGAMVEDDPENQQKHANFHGEVERVKTTLVAHRNSGSHIIGPLA